MPQFTLGNLYERCTKLQKVGDRCAVAKLAITILPPSLEEAQSADEEKKICRQSNVCSQWEGLWREFQGREAFFRLLWTAHA